MIAPIIAFLASTIGRYVIGGLSVLALFVAFKRSEQNKGMAKAVAQFEKKADANAQKANAARRAADKLPANSLRDAYFRD